MTFTKQEKVLIATNILGVFGFTAWFFISGNYEFILYVVVLAGLMGLVLSTHQYFHYSIGVLWALTAWSFLHLCGGGLDVAGDTLYNLMLIPIVGDPYYILKYDQAVHFFGFWTTAILTYYILKPSLKENATNIRSIIFIIVMTSLGLSAMNEIIEFTTTLFTENNVGGYENTAIDLVANFLGALGAGIYLRYKYFNKNNNSLE
ncbi:MAG: DUF2238 domain-containing protein [Patescibacteria group bacterium]